MTVGSRRRGPSRLRVATYNIHHGAPPGRRTDHRALVEAIASLSADIVVCQEVDRRTFRSGLADQMSLIGRALGMHGVFIKSRCFVGGGSVGNGLLSASPVGEVSRLDLPRSERRDRRRAFIAPVALGGGAVVNVVGTHLHPDPAEGGRQLSFLLEVTSGLAGPALLMGDLNAGPEQTFSALESAGWTCVGLPATFPAHEPTERIDHIAHRGMAGWELVRVEVPTVLSSDHLPAIATFRTH